MRHASTRRWTRPAPPPASRESAPRRGVRGGGGGGRVSLPPQMSRAIGLDLGTRRIGVALSDSAGTVATPHDVLTHSDDRAGDHVRIAELVAEVGAEVVVVGLPLSLDGSVGPAARGVLDGADELRARGGGRVVI